MNLTKFSIKKPAAVAVLILAVIAFGVFSYINMPLNLMPKIEYPVVTVVTTLPGASSTQIDEQIGTEISKRLSSVSGVTELTVSSMDSLSVVAITFDYGYSIDEAQKSVEDKLNGIDTVLPSEASLPSVAKIDIAGMPTATMSVSNDGDIANLTKAVEDIVIPELSKIDGVANTSYVGGQDKNVLIELNPEKAAKYGISQELIAGLVMGYNKSIPLGQVTYEDEKISIRSEDVLESIESLKDIAITQPTGEKIKLSEVCDIALKEVPRETVGRYNGDTNINISVFKKSGVNTLQVVSNIKDGIQTLNDNNGDFSIDLTSDESTFIMLSVNNVWSNLIIGGLLAILVLIIFLRSAKASIVVGSAIPLSIIAAVGLMYIFKVPLNMVSIGGMAIGVGMVVDNAIVVSESIYRYRADGFSPKKSAFLGCKLVAGAVVASTVTTVAVFFPIMFSDGLTKQIFTHLSLTIIFSLVASLLIAITVIPTLSVSMLNGNKHRLKIFTKFDTMMGNFFDAMERGYGKFASYITTKKTIVIVLSVVLFGSSLALIPLIGTEFLPASDQGKVNIEIDIDEAKTIADSEKKVDEIEKVLRETAEVDRIVTTIGGSESAFSTTKDPSVVSISCFLVDQDKRDRGIVEVAQSIRESFEKVDGATFRVAEVISLVDGMFDGAGGMSSPVMLNILSDNKEDMITANNMVYDVVKDIDGVINTKSDIGKLNQEIIVTVSPQKAVDYGLTSMQVSSVIRNAIAGITAGAYIQDDNSYDITIKYQGDFVNSIDDIKKMSIQTPMGVPVLLKDIADVEIVQASSTITKQDLMYKSSVSSFVVGRDSGSVNKDIQDKLDTISLPSGVKVEVGGEQSLMTESMSGLVTAIIFSICIVYVVLAIQFNSFKNPFIIMMSLPFAFSGSLIMLLLTGYTLNMTSMIGLIILVGIVVNNAIVFIDRINSLRLEGKPIKKAIAIAGQTRLRPILMTALTTILGLIPVAFASGSGAEIMAPMAVTVIGGMVTSTVLTLVIIPVLYAVFNRKELVIDVTDEI